MAPVSSTAGRTCSGPPAPGAEIDVHVLGAGRRVATVEVVEPASWHGIPGLVWRVRLRLPDGTTLTGFVQAGGRPWFSDPLVRAA